jgi:hypothetical protein
MQVGAGMPVSRSLMVWQVMVGWLHRASQAAGALARAVLSVLLHM